jgi:chitodextrinase
VSVVLVMFGATVPPATAQDPLIAGAGDISCDPASTYFNGGSGTGENCRQLATSRLLNGADRVFTLGDNQYEHGSLSNFTKSYAKSWGTYKDRTHPSIGNHEYGPPPGCGPDSCPTYRGVGGYFDYFGSSAGPRPTRSPQSGPSAHGYYSWNIGAWHVVVLNSMCYAVGGCGAGSPQERWLRQDLAANQDKKCVLAYWHHPPFTSGQSGNYTHFRAFWQALHEYRAEIVLVGHDHVYERFAPQSSTGSASSTGPREFMVGTGGKNLGRFITTKPNSQRRIRAHGILQLRLHPTSYDWRFARITDGASLDSGSAQCIHSDTAPAAPTGLSANAGDEKVNLDWNNNSEGDLAGYNVYRKTSSSSYAKLNASPMGDSQYTDSGLTNGTAYDYVVKAVDNAGNESAASNEVSARPEGATTPPGAPTRLTATPGDGRVDLDWADNPESDLDGYNVYRSDSQGGPHDKINGSLLPGSVYADGNVNNGDTYYYVVKAVDESGNESTASDEISATPSATPGYRDTVFTTPGLISYWRLGESSGTTAADEKGTNPGSYVGGVVLGQRGALTRDSDTAARFDGSDDEMTARGSALALSTTGTIEGWFNWESGVALMRDTTSSGGWILAYDSGGSLAYRVGGRTYTTSRATGSVKNGWHHFALTVSGGNTAFYLDGTRVHDGSAAGTTAAVMPWHVMRNGTLSGRLRGLADEVALYDTALPPSVIAAHYSAGR